MTKPKHEHSRKSDSLLMHELYRPFFISSILVAIIFVTGVVGYTIISPTHSVLDAVYMTVITLTTVGYGEIVDLSNNPGGRIFTMVLLVTGAGTFVYFFSAATAFVVEGHLEKIFWRRRMLKSIAALSGHYIVCGAGFTGRRVVEELSLTEREFVVIEIDEAKLRETVDDIGKEFPVLIGDATEDDNLVDAGIERAAGIFAALSNDKDNLIVTFSARLLNPSIRIVSRCIDPEVEAKIRRAGADAVILPSAIGGLRMVSEMVRPTVVSFLDVMLRDKDKRLRVEESRVVAGSKLDGMSVGELRHQRTRDALLIALKLDGGDWVYNPDDEVILTPAMTLVYMAGPGGREAIEQIAGRG